MESGQSLDFGSNILSGNLYSLKTGLGSLGTTIQIRFSLVSFLFPSTCRHSTKTTLMQICMRLSSVTFPLYFGLIWMSTPRSGSDFRFRRYSYTLVSDITAMWHSFYTRKCISQNASQVPRQLRWTSRDITFATWPSRQLKNWVHISSDSPQGI